jgi:methyl-accepting chemotaxis protein
MKRFRISFVTRVSLLISVLIFIAVFIASYIPLVIVDNENKRVLAEEVRIIAKRYKNEYLVWSEFVNTVKEFKGADVYELYRYFRESWWFIGEEGIIEKKGKEQYKEVAFSYFFFDGRLMRGDDPEIITNKGFIDYISNQMDKKETIEGKEEVVEVGDKGYLVLYAQANVGKTKGIIGMYFRPDYYVASFVEPMFGKHNFFYVKNGKFLIDEVQHHLDIKELKEAYDKVVGSDKFKKEGFGYIELGKHIYFVYREDYGDNVLAYEPKAAFSPVLISMVVGLPVALLVFLMNVFLIGRAFNRIGEVSGRIGELGTKGGDLSYRVNVGELALAEVRGIVENLNLFLEATEETVRVVKEEFRDVESGLESLGEVKRVIDELGGLVGKQDEVRQMVEEISAMAGEVSSTVEEIARTMEGVAGSVERQYGQIESISSMTEEAVMTLGNVVKRVNKVDEVLKGLRDEALRSSGEVRKVVEEARSIGGILGNVVEMIGVIKEIADRIEVLSMNAGIEAAHAGEYGRGFAVVADEMGNLAEDSRKKAMEVEEVVKRTIDRVRMVFEKVEESGEVFMKLSERVREVSVFVDEVNAAMVEVSKGNEEVLRGISNLVNYSESIKVAVMEGKSGVEEIMRSVYEVRDATSNLSEHFGELYDVLKGAINDLVRVSRDLPELMEGIRKVKAELDKFKVSSHKSGKVKSITVVEE